MKDPYAVLGLDKSADRDLLEYKYKELHDIYSEQRFKAGEEGNEGARKLQELEEAWVVIRANMENTERQTSYGGDFGRVDQLIREGKYNEAQDMLDSISDRGGEWHYMQAIIFYKREWLSEAKTQLEMALRDDPGNAKYKSSLDKLKLAMQNPEQTGRQQQQQASYNNGQGDAYGGYEQQPPQSTGSDMSNCLSSCCCAYCLTDCLCSTLRCL